MKELIKIALAALVFLIVGVAAWLTKVPFETILLFVVFWMVMDIKCDKL